MKLLWLDMETTGLDVADGHLPLEIAVMAADNFTNPIAEYQAVVKWDSGKAYMQCNEFSQKAHTRSGLLDRLDTGTPLEQVEQEILEFIDKHFPGEKPVIAGNSLGALDRPFIRHWFPRLEKRLHYRMLDVTAYRLGFVGLKLFPEVDKSKTAHRALDDIKESVEEFNRYKEYLLRSQRLFAWAEVNSD